MSEYPHASLKLFSIFILIFLLFNIGLISELVKDYPHSISLSQRSVETYDPLERVSYYNAYNIFEQDVSGAKWLSKNLDRHFSYSIYADYICRSSLVSYGGLKMPLLLNKENNVFRSNSFIFLGKPNIIDNLMFPYGYGDPFYTSYIRKFLYINCSIYSNGACEIYN